MKHTGYTYPINHTENIRVLHDSRTALPIITIEGQAVRDLHLILNRALNTWPEGPPEMFELSDILSKLVL